MARLTVLYWRDIPAQVVVKAGRRNAKVQLSERFEKAIDRAAMRAKLHGSDAYLEQWRRGAALDCGDDLEAEAEAAARRLETDYDDTRLAQLVAAGGEDTLQQSAP
ncbi:virulence factor [Pelagibius sp. CAU 1746]|uniref:virulence factor n=1 Tax=Pelagibius sp. CAU 1746 TaxID=3140370 RepID=UPI00325AFB93